MPFPPQTKSKSLFVKAEDLLSKAYTGVGQYIEDRPNSFLDVATRIPEEFRKTPIAKTIQTIFPKPKTREEELDALALNFTPMGLGTKVSKGIKPVAKQVAPTVFKGFKDLTTRVLEDLKGRSQVSKQFISDLANKPELRQSEREIIREVLKEAPENVSIGEFANKVKTKLLPLKVKGEIPRELVARRDDGGISAMRGFRYENISLPDEIRGPVASYKENIYESPIKTSAGSVHFAGDDFPNYFAHTRIEDLPTIREGVKPYGYAEGSKFSDQPTRRVIELQSDLFQKGMLEEGGLTSMSEADRLGSTPANAKSMSSKEWDTLEKQRKMASDKATKEMSQLEPYRNTWHERIIREEVKQAAIDGKTKLQFPTGETAMRIEGLGDSTRWHWNDEAAKRYGMELTSDAMKPGLEIVTDLGSDKWVITDVLGDGKFKAVPKDRHDLGWQVKEISTGNLIHRGTSRRQALETLNRAPDRLKMEHVNAEEFDISGKADQNNPIYKFYEKEVQKFLRRIRPNTRRIVDPQGVSWYEIDIAKKDALDPIQAFGALVPFLPVSQPLFIQDNNNSGGAI